MKNILVLTDFSASAARAADCALVVAAKLGADVLLVNVYPITPYLPPFGLAELVQSSPARKRRESTVRLNREIRRLEKRQRGSEVPGHRPAIRPIPLEGQLAECAAQLARRRDSLLILMGVSEISYGDLLFDGDVKAVLQLATRPMLIIPSTWNKGDLRHFLFASDLEEDDQQVLGRLVSLCALLKARVSVSHVSRPVLIPDFAEEVRVSAFMEKIKDLYPGIRCYAVTGANTLAALEKTSDERQADVIAMRYQKHPAFYRLFHENPLKEAIAYGKIPLLLFPANTDQHD